MALRWMRPTVTLAAIALAVSGCAQFGVPIPAPAGIELTSPVVFAAVASVEEGACPADRPNAYESRLSGVQCVFADPEAIVEAASGGVALVAASETTPEVPASIELTFEGSSSEQLRELTAALAAQAPPRNQLMVAVGGEVVAMPAVMDEFTDGTVSITGDDLIALYTRLTA